MTPSMGSASGAHIETTTKSGTNLFHGQVYEYFQNNISDAAPTFLAVNPFFMALLLSIATCLAARLAALLRKTRYFSLFPIRASASVMLSAAHSMASQHCRA